MKKTKNYYYSLNKNKKKKVSYSAVLKQQLSPKSPKDKQIQVTWVNSHGNQCKRIIQPNRCFCTHSFQCHQSPKTIGSAFCLSPGCPCKCYEYVPYYDIKCMCRHSYKDHDRNSKMCKMCNKCLGFLSNWSCKCGIKYELHQTVFQVKQITKIKSQRTKNMPILKSPKKNTIDITNFQQIGIDLSHQTNKQNQFQNILNKSMDARTYQMTKFDLHLNIYNKNQIRMQQHKKKQIDRINQKYGTIEFQKQVKNVQDMELGRIYKPPNAHTVTPLQLYIRPHNYHPVKLQKFLEKGYRKLKKTQESI